MLCANFKSQIRAQTRAIENNRAGIYVPRSRQVFQRPFCILTPISLAGPRLLAISISAIVKSQHVHACVMHPRQRVHRVSDVAVLPVQINQGEARVGGSLRRGNPPAFEA